VNHRRAHQAKALCISDLACSGLSPDELCRLAPGHRRSPPREHDILQFLAWRAPGLVLKRDMVELLAQAKPNVNGSAAELYARKLRMHLARSGRRNRNSSEVAWRRRRGISGFQQGADSNRQLSARRMNSIIELKVY